MGVILGIDIGGSTTKIVGLRRDGSVISMLCVHAEDQLTSLYGALGNYLDSNHLALGDVDRVVLTGVGYCRSYTGAAVYENGNRSYYEHRRLPKGGHGTGDVYASAFVGALMNGSTTYEAAKIAADYTVQCIENTQDDESHWYGVKFETAIPNLIGMLDKTGTER